MAAAASPGGDRAVDGRQSRHNRRPHTDGSPQTIGPPQTRHGEKA